MDSAMKAYKQLGSAERHYKERRNHIRVMLLPHLKGYELKACVEPLNEDLETLKGEISECEKAILQLKQGVDPEASRHKFRISYPISGRPKDIIERFKDEIEWRKQVAYRIRRERQIYAWEINKRRLAAAKLPIMRRQRASLNKKALKLLRQIKGLVEQLGQECVGYRKTCSQYYGIERQIRLLSFNREEPEGKTWVNIDVPGEIKELKVLRDLELEEEGKGKLRSLLRI